MVKIQRCLVLYALQLVLQLQAGVLCYQYKVGDLDAWSIPTAANPDVYVKWSKANVFRVGDSLLFLYPPSQDSMIQVTPEAYKACKLEDPILKMNDGNSVFNITQPGEFYFTSGEAGHCEKGEKLQVSIAGKGGIVYPPGALSDTAAGPSYTPAFGSIPTAPSSSSSSSHVFTFTPFLPSLIASVFWVMLS